MSRYHDYSYAGHRPAPRWPWITGLILLLGAPLVFLGLIQLNVIEGGPVRELLSQYVPAPDQQPGPAVAVVDATATVGPAPAEASSPTPAPTLPPTTTPAEVASAYVAAWTAGDYAALYDMLSAEAQQVIAAEDFIGRYQSIADRIELLSTSASVTGEASADNLVPIATTFTTEIAGEFTIANELPLVQQGDTWKVAWTPSLIFPALGSDGCVDVESEQFRRGRILDRNGKLLAYDGTVYRVGVVSGQFEPESEQRVLRELEALTDLSVDEIRDRYADANPDWFVPLKDFPEARGDELLQRISQLPGASVQPAVARVYPLGPRAAHVTGHVATANAEQLAADPTLTPGQVIGQAGIEAGANDLLSGAPGGRIIVVQCDTRAERATIAEQAGTPPRDVQLTIDSDLQIATDAALSTQGDARGSAVVLDPRDGAVLALASHPTYDPNGFILGFSDDEWDDINDDTLRPLLDRATQAAYPTGSIFKPITFVAALEHLALTPETVLDCPSRFSLAGASQVWEDWTVASGLGPQGPLTLHQGLVNSCNTIFYQLGRDLDQRDNELLPAMARALGLGAPTDIPYFPEIAGTLPDPAWKLETVGDYWATGDAVNLAIGQGFLEATPLHMANVYATLANGGQLLQPYIVATTLVAGEAPEQVGGRTERDQPPLSARTIAAVQAALRAQTSDWNGFGSVSVFGDFPWPIAGKTGTAQNNMDPEEKKPHSWFAAFGPYGEEATIASAVMIENAGEGVAFAAPVTKRIYEAYLASDLPGQPAGVPAIVAGAP